MTTSRIRSEMSLSAWVQQDRYPCRGVPYGGLAPHIWSPIYLTLFRKRPARFCFACGHKEIRHV